MKGIVDGNDLSEVFSQDDYTNYWKPNEPEVYEVSAFYEFWLIPWSECGGGFDGYSLWTSRIGGLYGGFSGTCAASPQVSALAARLFEERPWATWQQVRNRIMATARDPQGQIRGIVDYEAALEGW